MKRVSIYLLVAALCFYAGLLAHKLRPVAAPSAEVNKPLLVSICELSRDPALYDGKIVQVKAVLYGDRVGEPYLLDKRCGKPGAPSSKMIGLSVEVNQPFSVLPQWATYVSFCGNDDYAAMIEGLSAEVIVVGIFDGRQSQIIPRGMLQLSPASKQR